MRTPVDPDCLPEGTLMDCWRVVRRLGGGAYGTVYLVEKEGKLYALKLARFLSHSGDARHTDERAQRELSCLLSLHHPHIVQARAHGRWPGVKTGFFYVVMDYVEGCTLAEWLERHRPTPHEVVMLFDKVFSAVAHTHAQGILHRDLKPNNILVEVRTGQPVVVDFGAAHFPTPTEPRLTDTRLPPGTPRYTSPEARRFESLHRHDPQAHYEYKVADEMYALGVTLYDVLTDPLHHSHPQPQMMGLQGFPAARDVNARVPLVLSQFAAKLVVREPGQRPVSVEAARRELAEFLPLQAEEWKGRPLHAPVPPPSEAGEAAPLPSTASSPKAPAEPQEPQPVHHLPSEVGMEPPEPPEIPVPVPMGQVSPAQVSTAAPVVHKLRLPGPTEVPRRWLWRRVAVGTLVLGLLGGLGVSLSLRGIAHEEPAPALLSAEQALPPRPSSSWSEAPASAPASGASASPPLSLPPIAGAPPASTPEKGTAVNIRQPAQPAPPSPCAQKQPPLRDTPQWLKWCKCAAIAGTLVATQAGCPGAQVRQALTQECQQESINAMLLMEVDFDHQIEVELDVKQPSNGDEACGRDASGKIPLACIAEGPLTSRVVRGSGKLKRGTLLSGYAWIHGTWDNEPLYRWTEATLPDGSKHLVCLEASGGPEYCPNGTAQDCAAKQVSLEKRWRMKAGPKGPAGASRFGQ